MNFVSKFDGSQPFTGTHPKAQAHVETVQGKAPADAIVVKDANLLFNGDFKRSGADLVISKDDQELLLADYFKGEKRAPLASPDGAWLAGKIIETLTGYVQVAQADGSASVAPKIIGHVTKLTGNATVIRNGVSIILNNGDNVHQGDIVQSGSNSTVGITFIDGSVFGLASNARMVLNEMIYDPNGSNNSSLISLVQGTISFVAGATAKHGDMKVDTPVATMGIRGTAVVAEIDFEVTVPGSAPPVRFQVVVEPDGTSGSFVLLDRITLLPIATVNQPGTVTTVSGSGAVSFLSSAQLSPELMKLISEVFSQKFTDNSNPRSDTHFTDTVVPDNSFPVRFANGETGTAQLRIIGASEGAQGATPPAPKSNDHIPGAPGIFIVNKAFSEFTGLTGQPDPNGVQGTVGYTDQNPGDQPTVTAAFNQYGYKNAGGQDVTNSLTATQRSAIDAVSVPLHVAQDPNLKNNGTATWTYSVSDQTLDFLADGEKLTLTYVARVDNNFAGANEFSLAPFTITITGTNDTPTIESAPQTKTITEINNPDTHDSDTPDTATGAIQFRDVDLTDTHILKVTGVTAAGTMTGLQGAGGTSGTATIPISDTTVFNWLSLGTFVDSTDGVTGSRIWTFSAQDHYFDYLAETESVTLTYTVQVDDHHGGTVTQNVAVTITGSNDAPELAADVSGDVSHPGLHAITEQPGVTNASAAASTDDTALASLSFRDLDLSDTHTVSISAPSFLWGNTHSRSLDPGQITALTGASHIGYVLHDSNGTGNGSIDLNYSAKDYYFDFLAAGETLTITYDVTITDEHLVSSTRPVTITVTGTNDAPVAVADVVAKGVIIEAGVDANNAAIAGNADTSGNVLTNDTDVDITDTHTVVSVVAGTSNADGSGNVGQTLAGTYGDLVLNANGTWTYHLRDDYAATNALPQGAQVADVFTYTESDNHGATSTTTLTVNITGTNDQPVANAEPVAVPDAGYTVSEAGVNPGNTLFAGIDHVSGNVLTNDTDVDTGDTKTVNSIAHDTATSAVEGQTTIQGTYGSLKIAPNGSWTYTLDNTLDATQALTQDQHVTDVFTYIMNDKVGSTSSASLTIDVYGTNDKPVAVADVVASGVIVEAGHGADNVVIDGHADTGGNVLDNDTDVDASDTHTVIGVVAGTVAPNTDVSGHVGATVAGTYGELVLNANGTWTYHLRNDYAATNALPQDAQVADVFTYTESDNHGATSTTTLTVNVSGSNDTPVAVPDAGYTVSEAGVHPDNDPFAGVAIVSGNVLTNDTDVDTDDTKTVKSIAHDTATSAVEGQTTIQGTYGSLKIAPNGSWTYTLDNKLDATQALTQDQHVTDVFTYIMNDRVGSTSSASLTIDVYGTNDTPKVSDALIYTAAEGDGSHQLNLLAKASDIDADETLTLHVANVTYDVDGTPSGTPAGVTRSGDTLTIDPTNSAFDHLAVGTHTTITVHYNVKDAYNATVAQTESITIYGTNDPASIVGESNPPTHGVMVVNPVSPSIEPAGVNTNSLGFHTETFDNVSVGTGNFTSSELDATFTRSGSAGVVHGSSSSSAAPYIGPGIADPTNYLTIGGGATESILFNSSKNSFGLYWGSVDTYNSIKFYDGQTLVASYTGADVAPLLANGNQGSFSANGYVEFVGLHNFNRVVLSSTSNAFEIDNISAGNVPASHALLTGTVSGTMSVHDADIGDTLTGVVTANATATFNNSQTLPSGVSNLLSFGNISFDSVQSDGGTDVLHWNYNPHGANLDFLHAGDVLKITYTAKVSDGHGSYGSQQLTVTLVGTDNDTNVSSFKFVDGTSGNDTFSNAGGGTTLVGNGGHDNFIFKPNSGSATITDFDPANDVLTFDSSMFGHNPANVLNAAQADGHGNTVIPLSATDTITLLHILPNQLNNSDFHFV